MIRCVRLWTGEDHNSHFEEGFIDLGAGPARRLAERKDRCRQHLLSGNGIGRRFRLAHRAGPATGHHAERHAGFPDA